MCLPMLCGDVGLISTGGDGGDSALDGRDLLPVRWASAINTIKRAGLDVGGFVSMVQGLPDDVVVDLIAKIKSDCEVL
jgi:hypothetical protein